VSLAIIGASYSRKIRPSRITRIQEPSAALAALLPLLLVAALRAAAADAAALAALATEEDVRAAAVREVALGIRGEGGGEI
jgi:hypothetical protein